MLEKELTVRIRYAVSSDLEPIKKLADFNRVDLGFVLRAVLSEGIADGRVYVADVNSAIVGFVHFRHRQDGWTTIYEICTATEVRRKGVGTQLLLSLVKEITLSKRCGVQLKCPTGSAANDFYLTVGMHRAGEVEGRKRNLVLWQWKTRVQ